MNPSLQEIQAFSDGFFPTDFNLSVFSGVCDGNSRRKSVFRRNNNISIFPTDFPTEWFFQLFLTEFPTAFATECFFHFVPTDIPTALPRTPFTTDRSVGKINLKKYPSIIPADWSVGNLFLK
ncbi:MAG: hypothetical protein Q8877_03080 [Sweet potato little leaf phytoplasma]|nr:hypothetical protein [Sweet potato little leaf phytoplasma]